MIDYQRKPHEPYKLEKRCSVCGILYFGHPQSKYCEDCRLVVKAKQKAESRSRAREYRNRAQSLEKPQVQKRKEPNMSLVEIAKAAKKAGMSYGQFVQKFSL